MKIRVDDYNTVVNFPDGMDMEEVQTKLKEKFPPLPKLSTWEQTYTRPLVQGNIAAQKFSESVASFSNKVDMLSGVVEDGLVGAYTGVRKLVDSHYNPDHDGFLPYLKKGGGFGKAADLWGENAEMFKQNAVKYGYNKVDEIIGGAAGGAPVGITEFMMNVPWATMTGAVEAKRQGKNWIWGGLEEGVMRWGLGKFFGALHPYKKYVSVPSGAAAMGAETYIKTGDIDEGLMATAQGGLMMATSKGGYMGMRDLAGKQKVNPFLIQAPTLTPKLKEFADEDFSVVNWGNTVRTNMANRIIKDAKEGKAKAMILEDKNGETAGLISYVTEGDKMTGKEFVVAKGKDAGLGDYAMDTFLAGVERSGIKEIKTNAYSPENRTTDLEGFYGKKGFTKEVNPESGLEWLVKRFGAADKDAEVNIDAYYDSLRSMGGESYVKYAQKGGHTELDVERHGHGKKGSESKAKANYTHPTDESLSAYVNRLYAYGTKPLKDPDIRNKDNPEHNLGKEIYFFQADNMVQVHSPLWKELREKAIEKLKKDGAYDAEDPAAVHEMTNRMAKEGGYNGVDLGDAGAIFLQSGLKTSHVNPVMDKVLESHEVNGGGTFNMRTGEDMAGKPLYSVGVGDIDPVTGEVSLRTYIAEKKVITHAELKKFIVKNADLLSNPNFAVGTWYEAETGRTWLDVVALVADKQKATALGERFNQKAIFNLKEMEVIDTGGTGEMGTAKAADAGMSTSAKVEGGGSDGDGGSGKKADKEYKRFVKLSTPELQELAQRCIKATSENNYGYIGEVFKHLQVNGDVQRLVDEIAKFNKVEDATGTGTRHIKTLGQTVQDAEGYIKGMREELETGAKDMGYFVNELKGLSNNLVDAVYQLQAWKRVLIDFGGHVDGLHKKAAKASATELDKLDFINNFQMLIEIEALMRMGQANVGRALGANRLQMEGAHIDFSQLTEKMILDNPLVQNQIDVLRTRFKDADIEKVLTDWKEVKIKQPKSVKIYVNKLQGSKLGNVLLEGTNVNLLSSLWSQSANLLGNVGRVALDFGEAYLGVGVGKMLSKINPKRDRVTLGESNARVVEMLNASLDAFVLRPYEAVKKGIAGVPEYIRSKKSFVDILQDIIDAPEKFEQWNQTTGVDPYAMKTNEAPDGKVLATTGDKAISSAFLRDSAFGKIADTVMLENQTAMNVFWKMLDVTGASVRDASYGLLNFVDKPFKEIHYRGEVAAQLYKRSLTKENPTQWTKDMYEKVLNYRENKPFEAKDDVYQEIMEIDKAGIDMAREGTWQAELPTSLKKAQSFLVSSPMARVAFAQFFKTPVNLLKYPAERFPVLSLGFKEVRADLMGSNGALAQNKAIAQQLMGHLLVGAATSLFLSGRVTGAHPPEIRQALLQSGIPENSIYVGDKWIDYNRIEPIGTILSMVANFMSVKNYIKADHAEDMHLVMVLATSKSILSKTWMTQTRDLLEFFTDPKRNWKAFEQSWVTKLSPMSGLVRWGWGQYDPYVREAKTFNEMLTAVYAPVQNRMKLDSLGEVVDNVPKYAGMKITTPKRNDPIYMEMAKLKMSIPHEDDKFSFDGTTIEMTPEESWKLRRALSENFHVKDFLNKWVSSEKYQRLPAAVQAESISDILSDFREMAASKVLYENKKIVRDIVNQKKADVLNYLTIHAPDQATSSDFSDFLTPKPNYKVPRIE